MSATEIFLGSQQSLLFEWSLSEGAKMANGLLVHVNCIYRDNMMNDHYSVMKVVILSSDLIHLVLLLGLHLFGLKIFLTHNILPSQDSWLNK